ncbi:DNA-binding protein WhiA [Mycoplasmopsis felifaucium]|uniref:Probable cell division protein WhiA n=1 Tax=Mycoplasmopsis felifaucium TaxID=35768 RepID=A0ABZ2RQ06_9BACT
MNFTQEVKNEIFQKKKTTNGEIKEFLRGFIYAKSYIENEKIKLRINDQDTKNLIVKYLIKLGIKVLIVNMQIVFNLSDFDLTEKFTNPSAFYQGVFAGSGSINNLDKSSYHLQISSNYKNFIDIIMNKLNEYDFEFNKIQHQNRFLIYIKKYEKICDFLKAIMASNSLFIFMENTINRDFNNNINRLNNIDFSNIKKSVNANQAHIKNINFIFSNNLTSSFKNEQIDAFNILLDNPESSLNSLVDIYNNSHLKPISKSGLYHWLNKLSGIVKKHSNIK